MSLTAVLQHVAAGLPADHPAVFGPPFRVPPAAPCYVVEMPQLTEVLGAGPTCRVVGATVDVVCVPQTGTDHDMLITMADAVIAAFGSAVTGGQAEPNPYTDTADVWCYRLTVEM